MPFTWSTLGVGYPINDDYINEFKTNIDTLYTTLVLTHPDCVSGAGWTLLPVSVGGSTTYAQIAQVRTKLDYAYENNCTTVHSVAYSGEDATHYVLQDTHNSGYHGTHDTGYENHDHSYLNNYQDEEMTTIYTTDFTGDHTGYCSTDRSPYYNGNDTDHNGSEWGSYDNADCGSYTPTRNITFSDCTPVS